MDDQADHTDATSRLTALCSRLAACRERPSKLDLTVPDFDHTGSNFTNTSSNLTNNTAASSNTTIVAGNAPFETPVRQARRVSDPSSTGRKNRTPRRVSEPVPRKNALTSMDVNEQLRQKRYSELHAEGDKLESWIAFLKEQRALMHGPCKHTLQMYNVATTSISTDSYRKKDSYAQLWTEYARLQVSVNVDEANDSYTFMKTEAIGRSYRYFYTARAQFESDCGNASKSQDMLKKVAECREPSPEDAAEEQLFQEFMKGVSSCCSRGRPAPIGLNASVAASNSSSSASTATTAPVLAAAAAAPTPNTSRIGCAGGNTSAIAETPSMTSREHTSRLDRTAETPLNMSLTGSEDFTDNGLVTTRRKKPQSQERRGLKSFGALGRAQRAAPRPLSAVREDGDHVVDPRENLLDTLNEADTVPADSNLRSLDDNAMMVAGNGRPDALAKAGALAGSEHLQLQAQQQASPVGNSLTAQLAQVRTPETMEVFIGKISEEEKIVAATRANVEKTLQYNRFAKPATAAGPAGSATNSSTAATSSTGTARNTTSSVGSPGGADSKRSRPAMIRANSQNTVLGPTSTVNSSAASSTSSSSAAAAAEQEDIHTHQSLSEYFSALPTPAQHLSNRPMRATTSSSSTTATNATGLSNQATLMSAAPSTTGTLQAHNAHARSSSFSAMPVAAVPDDVKPPLLRSQSQPVCGNVTAMGGVIPISGPADGALSAEEPSVVMVNGKPFEKLKQIGNGGSSKVYRVLGPDRNCYALKAVDLCKADDATIESYANEIKLLKLLQGKPCIIRLYEWEINRHSQMIYIVMECGDVDLSTMLRNRRSQTSQDGTPANLDENHVRLYWQQMLEAVRVIHSHDTPIIHGDLKPQNFLFVEGALKLIDFGIAKAVQEDHTSILRETQIGTLNYMSPESIQSGGDSGMGGRGGGQVFKIGPASDVWSLGCILYAMVYGRTPFQHINRPAQKLLAIINPGYQIEYKPVANAALLEVMQGCLERDPKKRMSIDVLLKHKFLNPSAETSAGGVTQEQLQAILSLGPASPNTLSRRIMEQLARSGAVVQPSTSKAPAAPAVIPVAPASARAPVAAPLLPPMNLLAPSRNATGAENVPPASASAPAASAAPRALRAIDANLLQQAHNTLKPVVVTKQAPLPKNDNDLASVIQRSLQEKYRQALPNSPTEESTRGEWRTDTITRLS